MAGPRATLPTRSVKRPHVIHMGDDLAEYRATVECEHAGATCVDHRCSRGRPLVGRHAGARRRIGFVWRTWLTFTQHPTSITETPVSQDSGGTNDVGQVTGTGHPGCHGLANAACS